MQLLCQVKSIDMLTQIFAIGPELGKAFLI